MQLALNVTLSRARRKLHVSPQKPLSGRDDTLPMLPPELWESIAQLLDLEDLKKSCFLNRTLYNTFLSRKYRIVKLVALACCCNFQKEIALLHAMQDPLVKENIRELHVERQWEDFLIFALNMEDWKSFFPRIWSRAILSMLGRMKKARRQTLQKTIQSAMAMLSHLTKVSVDIDSGSNCVVLDALWTACSPTIVDLTLYLCRPLQTPNHTFGVGVACPRLRSLHVSVFPMFSPYPHLPTELRSLIPEDGGCMEKFSIHLQGNQQPWVDTSFGALRNLLLEGDDQSLHSLLPFTAPHRDTLQELTLRTTSSVILLGLTLLNVDILTTLSVSHRPFLDRKDELFPFISRCARLRTFALSHTLNLHLGELSSAARTPLLIDLLQFLPQSLTHLTFPGLVVDFNIFLSVSQRLPNISSLTLGGCYPANHQIEARFFPMADKKPWALQFENLQSQRQAFAQEDLTGSNTETIFKFFLGSMTRSALCCQ